MLTSGLGVPGMEPYVEFARVFGGVGRRRPYLSKTGVEVVRARNDEVPEAVEPPEPVRWWCFSDGRVSGCSVALLVSAGADVGFGVLLALTRFDAACGSCCCRVSASWPTVS